MNKSISIALAVAVAGAAGFALHHDDTAAAGAPVAAAPAAAPMAGGATAPPLDDPDDTTLPPNHPAIPGSAPSPHGADFAPPSQEPAALKWSAPAAWSAAPNPSTMRLATYKVPRAKGDTDDAELSVSRAGGDTEANIQRWVGQFDDRGKEQRRTKTVRGLKVAIVEVDGTYSGGMGPAAGTHTGWALLGAIVETPGQPYFFKLTGPAASVHGARAAFDAMLDGVAPN